MSWYNPANLFKERPLLCESSECKKPIEGKAVYWPDADRVYHAKCEINGEVEEVLRQGHGLQIKTQTLSVEEIRKIRKDIFL